MRILLWVQWVQWVQQGIWMNIGSGWPCCSFASSVLEIGCANGANGVEERVAIQENMRQVNLKYLHQYTQYPLWHQKKRFFL